MEIQRELETFSQIDKTRDNPEAADAQQANHVLAYCWTLSYLVSPHLKKVSGTK
jgi:hypothetical protein